MIGPRLAAAATMAVAKPLSYAFVSDGTKIDASALASDTAVPDTVAKPAPASIVTCAKPPRTRPTRVLANAIRRSMMFALIISSPANIKNGIDISGNELTECIMRCGTIEKSTPPSHKAIIEATPIAKAIGKPNSASNIKPTMTNRLILLHQ